MKLLGDDKMENKNITVKIILKSGYEIPVICEEFSIKYNPNGAASGYEYKGLDIKNGINPIYINVNEIAAVISYQ